jgi:hypothetical protein
VEAESRWPVLAARVKGIRMTARRLITWVVSLLVAVGVMGPGVASAAAPTFERITIDETFVDEELSEACGVLVTVTVRGQITFRTFPDEGTGLVALNTLNIGGIATADGRTFRFRDVGGDLVRIEPDGTALLYVIGQVPFEFAGVLIIDLETDEVILEPRDRSAQQIERACAVLTGG